jgi:CRISPR system Cascade subunit CasE
LLVQSSAEPDWSRLPKDYLRDYFDELDNPAVKRVDEKYGALGKGIRLRFRLRANPTKRLPLLIENRTGKERGKRVEIFGEENQLAWLARKAGEHGFRLLAANVNPSVVNARANPEGKVIGWRDRLEAPMKFGSALFEGELEITDAEVFKRTLAEGIGSGKAYGFGLLSVAPAR